MHLMVISTINGAIYLHYSWLVEDYFGIISFQFVDCQDGKVVCTVGILPTSKNHMVWSYYDVVNFLKNTVKSLI